MTVIFQVGRRLPRSWYKRQANRIKGLISFQENIWLIIKQSLQLAKRKANADGRLKFVITYHKEIEDLHYELDWIKVLIQGTEEQEKEEYEDCLKIYDKLSKQFKKEFPVNEHLKKHFKTKMLSPMQIEDAYKKGYGAMEKNNISNKLLEMGILTHIEWIKDFDSRTSDVSFDL